ncbi:MAG: DUF6152 family protein [Gammaproteobacteria bacterium]
MKKFATLVAALTVALSAAAHHNPGYYFDMRQVIVHSDATVVSYEPANPHGRLIYSMPDEDGVDREWVAELPANNMMRRYGVGADLVSPGDVVTMRGNPGRNGATMLRITHVLLPSGDVATFYAPQGTGTVEDLQVGN